MNEFCLLLVILLYLSCSSDAKDIKCISFDTRQCMGDPWTDSVDRNADAISQANQLHSYFSSMSISIEAVKADPNYHDIVCEACFICPENPRYLVKANIDEIIKLEALELLNFTSINCSQF